MCAARYGHCRIACPQTVVPPITVCASSPAALRVSLALLVSVPIDVRTDT